MKGKALFLLMFAAMMCCCMSQSDAVLYDIDDVVNIVGGNWVDEPIPLPNGHALRTYTLTIKNNSLTTSYEDVSLLLQWSWVKDWREGTGTMWYAMDYQTFPRRWYHPDSGATYDGVISEPYDNATFVLASDIVGLKLTYAPSDYEGVAFEDASVALTDMLPAWTVGDLAPQESITITAHVEFYREEIETDDFNLWLAGDVIGTPIPEPSILMLIGMSLAAIKRSKR